MWFGGCWTCELDTRNAENSTTHSGSGSSGAEEMNAHVRAPVVGYAMEKMKTTLHIYLDECIMRSYDALVDSAHPLVSIGTSEFHRRRGSRYLDSYLIVYGLCAFQRYTLRLSSVLGARYDAQVEQEHDVYQLFNDCDMHDGQSMCTHHPFPPSHTHPIDDVVVVTWTNNISFYNEQVSLCYTRVTWTLRALLTDVIYHK